MTNSSWTIHGGGDLSQHAVRMRTLDPGDEDWSDLRAIAPLLAHAKVIGIGESTHYTREFALLKHRFLRFLVAELGVTAFVMESGFPEGLAVGRWLAGADDDLGSLLERGFTNGFGNSGEMRDQLLWMRSRGIRFYGVDIPGTGWSPNAAIAELERGDPRFAAMLRAELAGLGSAIGQPPIETERHAAINAILVGIADELRPRMRDDPAAAAMWQCVAGLITYTDIAASPQVFDARRDESMARTVEWILAREHRIVLGGANAHIQRVAYPTRTGQLAVLGQHLSASLGGAYAAIGTTFGRGSTWRARASPPDRPERVPTNSDETVDRLLARTGIPLFAVATDCLPNSPATRAMREHSDVVNVDVRRAFDLVVHVDNFTPATRVQRDDVSGP